MTTIAFRPNDKYFLHSFFHTDPFSISLELFLYFKFWNYILTVLIKNFIVFFSLYVIWCTFNNNKIIMVRTPSNVSQSRVSLMCVKTLTQDSIKAFVDPFMPSSDLTWLLPIVIAAAIVKPTVTYHWIHATQKMCDKNIVFLVTDLKWFTLIDRLPAPIWTVLRIPSSTIQI